MEIRTINDSELYRAQALIPENWHADIAQLFRRYHANPSFYPLVAVDKDSVAAYGQVFLFDKTAWLGNITVHRDYRRKGIGQALTEELISYSFSRGISTIHLTATEMALPMYRKLGFKTDSLFMHYSGSTGVSVCENIRPIREEDHDSVFDISYRITGETKDAILSDYLSSGYAFEHDGRIRGFFLPAHGSGIVLALDDEAGRELLRFKHCDPFATSVLSEENEAGIEFLESMNLRGKKASTRMYLGEYTPWYPSQTWSRGTTYSG